jgi:hypothetical protein
MVHEFGHYSGLAHSIVNGQILIGDTSGPTPENTFGFPAFDDVETMYPFYFGPGVGMSSPHQDDISALSTLYPGPGFASGSVTISGTIRRSNGEPVTGVNVIARNIANPFDDAASAISGDYAVPFIPGDPLIGTYTLKGLTPAQTMQSTSIRSLRAASAPLPKYRSQERRSFITERTNQTISRLPITLQNLARFPVLQARASPALILSSINQSRENLFRWETMARLNSLFHFRSKSVASDSRVSS